MDTFLFMNYKLLHDTFPLEIVIYIGSYDNGPKKNMNKVIEELNKYNNDVMEYENVQYYEWLFPENESNRNIKRSWTMEIPYLLFHNPKCCSLYQ